MTEKVCNYITAFLAFMVFISAAPIFLYKYLIAHCLDICILICYIERTYLLPLVFVVGGLLAMAIITKCIIRKSGAGGAIRKLAWKR